MWGTHYDATTIRSGPLRHPWGIGFILRNYYDLGASNPTTFLELCSPTVTAGSQ